MRFEVGDLSDQGSDLVTVAPEFGEQTVFVVRHTDIDIIGQYSRPGGFWE